MPTESLNANKQKILSPAFEKAAAPLALVPLGYTAAVLLVSMTVGFGWAPVSRWIDLTAPIGYALAYLVPAISRHISSLQAMGSIAMCHWWRAYMVCCGPLVCCRSRSCGLDPAFPWI